MRLVLDTNVLIAAFIAHGVCGELLEHCARVHEIVLSDEILSELRDVLERKFKYPSRKARQLSDLLRNQAEIIQAPPLPLPVCRDPDDDAILAVAVAGKCRAILSGDKDLTVLKRFEGIDILPPNEFWQYEQINGSRE